MAYRLMLVDDEADIREGMKRIVDWEQYGFELIGEADNGMDALLVAEQMRPDLVITDIRMHFMDGLEMIEKMRGFLPMTQFVVLSGYDEFQYVRKSIQMRIVDYVLKPISAREFEMVLARAKDALDQEHEKRRNTAMLNEYLQQSLPLLREQLLGSLLSGDIDDAEARDKAERYGMQLEAQSYAAAILSVTGERALRGEPLGGDAELARLAVDKIVREVLEERLDVRVFHHNGRVAVLCLLKKDQSLNTLMALLDTACSVIWDYLGVRCACGVGEPCTQLSQLPRSARQAQSALDHWALVQDASVIFINDLQPQSSDTFADERTLARLSDAIKMKQRDEIAAQVHLLIERVRAAQMSFSAYQIYMLEVWVSILRTARELQADANVLREAHGRVMEDFLRARDLGRMEEMLLALCLQISESISIGRQEFGQRIVEDAIALMNGRFCEESFAIEQVVEQLHISPSYFRALFKRETGQTFHQSLTALRMSRAMELLRTTDLKTAHIAEQIGLGEPSYFSYSFKKYFGVSPSQVRKDAVSKE